MERKIKRMLSMLVICSFGFMLLSTVMVYAPPTTEKSNPFQRVIITNTDPVPVSIEDEPVEVTGKVSLNDHEPFQTNGGFLIEQSYRGASEIEVPEDSILVIEFISIGCYGTSEIQNILCRLNSLEYYGIKSFDSIIIGPFDKLDDTYIKTMPIKMYHDSENILELEINLSIPDDVIVRFTISGYLMGSS